MRGSLRVVAGLVAVAAGVAGSTVMAAQALGPELRLNGITQSRQWNADVAASPAGDFVAAWSSAHWAGDVQVMARRFAADGTPLGDEFQVNTYTTWVQTGAAVAVAPDGEFVVVWNSWYQDGSGIGIFGQRYDAAANPVGGEFMVPSTTAGDQVVFDVAMDAAGGFVVVWSDEDEIGARRFDADGVPLESDVRVNTYTTGWQSNPALGIDPAGNFLIVWDSQEQDGDGFGVFGQRFDRNGVEVGAEFQVNSYSTLHQWHPSVALDETGRALVVWSSYRQDELQGDGVYGQRYAADGEPLGVEFRVNTYTTGRQVGPAAAFEANGDFVVAWSGGAEQDGDGDGIFAQQFDHHGERVGPEFQVNAYTSRDQFLTSIAAAGPAHFVLAWESDGQDGSSWGVYARRVHAGAFLEGGESGQLCGWTTAVPERQEIAPPACPPQP